MALDVLALALSALPALDLLLFEVKVVDCCSVVVVAAVVATAAAAAFFLARELCLVHLLLAVGLASSSSSAARLRLLLVDFFLDGFGFFGCFSSPLALSDLLASLPSRSATSPCH